MHLKIVDREWSFDHIWLFRRALAGGPSGIWTRGANRFNTPRRQEMSGAPRA